MKRFDSMQFVPRFSNYLWYGNRGTSTKLYFYTEIEVVTTKSDLLQYLWYLDWYLRTSISVDPFFLHKISFLVCYEFYKYSHWRRLWQLVLRSLLKNRVKHVTFWVIFIHCDETWIHNTAKTSFCAKKEMKLSRGLFFRSMHSIM